MLKPSHTLSRHQLVNLSVIVILSVIGLLIYSNTFYAPFQLDDSRSIVRNEHIRNINQPISIWSFFKTRFICYLSFAVNYRLHGLNLPGYHLVNIGIHIINGILLFFLANILIQLWKSDLDRKTATGLSLCTALIFLCHPLQTEGVTYIVQRLVSLATLSLLASTLFYMKSRMLMEADSGRKNRAAAIYYIIAFLFGLIGIHCKETFIVLPAILLTTEWLFFRQSSSTFVKRILYLLPFAMIILIIPFYGMISGVSLNQMTDRTIHLSRGQYLLTELHVLTTYLRLFIFPMGQNFDYDFPIAGSLFEPIILLSLFIIIALVIGGFAVHKKLNIITFGLFWFFITLSPQSSIIPLVDVIFEHRAYPGTAGLSLAATIAIYILLRKRKPAFTTALFACIIIALSLLTFNRNVIWRSSITLWEDTVEKSPGKSRPHNNLGLAYYENGFYDKAESEFLAALNFDPENHEAYRNMALIKYEQKNISAALDYLEKGHAIKNDNLLIMNDLAWLLATCSEEELRNGKRSLELALEICNITEYKNARFLDTLAAAYAETGQYLKAIDTAKTAMEIALIKNNSRLHKEITQRIIYYNSNSPYHEEE